MLPNKSSKKSNKTPELSATPVSEPIVTDSKPAKRTKPSSSAANTPTPKQAPHRHSKLAVPVTPVQEAAVAEVSVMPTAVVVSATVSTEDVARLAYSFWEERNYSDGFADEDWHRAEKALSAAC